MKNIVLGIIGLCISIYVLLIGLNVYILQTHKEQLENTVSQVVLHTLENGYETKNKEESYELLEKDMQSGVANAENLKIKIRKMDLEKGIISVVVTEKISLLTGQVKTYSVEKTAIMEREEIQEDMVTVTFLVEEETYKEYQLVKGENCPMPKIPNVFSGWVEYGDADMKLVEKIGEVWEDKVFIAVQ